MAGKPPRNRRVANVAVRFPLDLYVDRLGSLFDCKVGEVCPGPISVSDRSGGPCHTAVEYLFSELMSKFDDMRKESATARWESCLSRFYEAEELCRDTNWRFRDKSFLYYRVLTDSTSAGSVFNRAAQKIARVLGPLDDANLQEGCDFGPGATTRLPRTKSHRAYKLAGSPHATIQATPLVFDYLVSAPGWREHLCSGGPYFEIVGGNKVVAVPKNYKTDRMIAIEPDWLIFLQKGIGSHIRKRLKRIARQDLNDQETNGFLAGLGSIDGSLATIDLSMASDCVSIELVRYLLPPEWYDVLEQVRSPRGVLPSGEIVTYQKFSSMGNGFTFELESLIFWALCSSVVELMKLEDRRVYVYGDDIVVPADSFPKVIETLTLAGFVPNPKKSFASGPFRESCGQHWLDGDLITPIYIREAVNRLDRLFLLHNNTCRLLERLRPFVTAAPSEVSNFLEWIRSFAPARWQKPRLPRLDIGDGAFYGTFELSLPRRSSHRDRRTWSCWEIGVISPRIIEDTRVPEVGNLLSGLWKLERSNNAVLLDIGQIARIEQLVPLEEPLWKEGLVSSEWMRVVGRPDVPKWMLIWHEARQIVRGQEADQCWWES